MQNTSDIWLFEYTVALRNIRTLQAKNVASDSFEMKLAKWYRKTVRYRYIEALQREEQCNLATCVQRLGVYG